MSADESDRSRQKRPGHGPGRSETRVGIAYGTNIDLADQTIIDPVGWVQGVLADDPVEVLYDEMRDWAMILRVGWWIESYVDTRRMYDGVHRAQQEAPDEAGIEGCKGTQTMSQNDESE